MEKQDLAKIAITTDADTALVQALEKVNKDHTGGRVTKTELSSWFILQSANNLTDNSVEEIRMAHFSQVAYLEALVKTIKRSGRDMLNKEEFSKLQAIAKQQSTKPKNRAEQQTKENQGVTAESKPT